MPKTLSNRKLKSEQNGKPQSITERSLEDSLVLQAWETISAERHLQGVLEAVSQVLWPAIPFASVAIIHFDGAFHGPYAAYVVGEPRHDNETLEEYFQRLEPKCPRDVPTRPLVPYDKSVQEKAVSGRPYTCADLFEKESWYEHEFHLAAAGIRAYVSIPLIVRGKMIGGAVFTRLEPNTFTERELSILQSVARALAVAVANALANEEIRRLRDELQAENIALKAVLGELPWAEGIIGDSPALRRVLESVEQVASTDATVLITGETGTGKELIARAIHRRSRRARGPLVKVNCAAIPESLLASELFGHERGAFTGAVERRKGRFEQAHGGTLFLDEIGEMPAETQVLLLRVLQEREFERLGGNQTVQVDVRIVAATNRDLEEQVRQGRFRSDLYYRLNVFPVHLPPLRERTEDISLLAAHFASKYSTRFGRTINRIESRTLNTLSSYHWPGNIRELENIIERAVILSSNATLRIDHNTLSQAREIKDVSKHLRTEEKSVIESALRVSHGRIAGKNGAAAALGLAPSTLEFRINRLGIDKFQFRKKTR